MQPGVDAVEAVPGMTWTVTVLVVVGIGALLSTVAAAYSERWARAVASGVVLAAVVGTVVVLVAPRLDAWREVYDYDATWARLEARYGIELSAQARSTRLPGPPGRHSAGIVDQDALDAVVMPDGSVRDDLFLQYARGEPARVAIVTRPAGASSLVVTRGGWWDEIPLADGGA